MQEVGGGGGGGGGGRGITHDAAGEEYTFEYCSAFRFTDKIRSPTVHGERQTHGAKLATYAGGSHWTFCLFVIVNRLVGLVVKASASRAEGPGFESRLRRDFFGVESYQ